MPLPSGPTTKVSGYYIIACCAESELLSGAIVLIPNSSTGIEISGGFFDFILCVPFPDQFLLGGHGSRCVVCINRLGFELKPSGVKEKKLPQFGYMLDEALMSTQPEQKKIENILF